MKFGIERIFRNDTYNKRPLTIEFTLPPDRPVEDITDPLGKVYFIDLAGKNLKTFKAFREIVVDEFGVWLSDPADMKWNDIMSKAFIVGLENTTYPATAQENLDSISGGGWSDFEGREIDRAFAGEPTTHGTNFFVGRKN